MNKMTKHWVATASLLHPATSSEVLVSQDEIQRRHQELFGVPLAQSLEQQLISWKPRYADKRVPTRGGSRKRFLFRTSDGHTPDRNGRFRLYKLADSQYGGMDKPLGPTCPSLDEVQEEFHYLVDWYITSYRDSSSDGDLESEADIAEKEIQLSDLPPTEKTVLIDARRGQGVFRSRVGRIEKKCRVTGITDPRFLVASHIKPWACSANVERLDGNNGLMLSPHIDRLFDRGFITFDQDGAVTIAPEATEVCRQWHITPQSAMPLSHEQEQYMQYHRVHVYRHWTSASRNA